jgi:hypothetical protein
LFVRVTNRLCCSITRGKILVESGMPPVFEIATQQAQIYTTERDRSNTFAVGLLKDPRFS